MNEVVKRPNPKATAAVLNFPICSSTSTPKYRTQPRTPGHAGIFGHELRPSHGIA
jgi:hypothetical protein